MPLPSHFATFGTERVVVIHNADAEDESRIEVEAHIQAESGFFAVDTPIYEGDVVEVADPRGGATRRLVSEVHVNNPRGPAFSGMGHIQVVDSTLVGVAKPDPAIFRPALAALGTAPARTLYVGDTVHADVHGATAAGMPVVQLDPYDLHADFDHPRIPDVDALAGLLLTGR